MKLHSNPVVMASFFTLVLGATIPSEAASPHLATGFDHSVLLNGSGELWTWGDNTFGQLGYDTTIDADTTNTFFSNIPQRLGSDTDWVQITAGEDFTLALKNDGTLYGWGHNDTGQLGLGTADTTDRPAPVQVGTSSDWSAVSAGVRHTVALKTDGTLWTWGHNSHGELGAGWPAGTRDFTAHPVPAQVGSDNDWAAIWTHGYHTLALKTDSSLWAWGDNTDGQSGTMPNLDPSAPADGEFVLEPLRVGSRTDWVALGPGIFHSVSILQDGTLWGFGSNVFGELGTGVTSTTPNPTPSQVGSANLWSDIRGGEGFTVGIMANGALWTWGDNASGQLGYDTSGNPGTAPGQVGTAATWIAAAAGNGFVLALDNQGNLWGWGNNTTGQLGLGNTTNQPEPTTVEVAKVGQDMAAPTLSITPAGGTYSSDKTVTLLATDDVTAAPSIYYTLDGTDPDSTDTTQRYTGPVTVRSTTTIRFLAVDTAGNESAVASESFTIQQDGESSSGGCFLSALPR